MHQQQEYEQQYQEYVYTTQQQEVPSNQQPPFVQPPLYHYTLHTASMTDSLLALLSYLFLWPGALIVLLFVRDNRFVRFHALQSLLFFGGVNMLYIVFFNVVIRWPWHAHYALIPLGLAFLGANIIAFIAWLVGIVGAVRGIYLRLPFVGELAARAVGSTTTFPK